MTRFDTDALEALVRSVVSHADNLPQNRLVLVPAHRGSAATGSLMLVGRAPNGWSDSWLPRETRTHRAIRQLVHGEVQEASPGENCPLAWVTDQWGAKRGYNTKRSAFWRLGRAL